MTSDPYPLYEPGPFWEVAETIPGTGLCWQLEEQPQRDTYAEAKADLSKLRREIPTLALTVRQVPDRWRARCVACGETADQEDYVYGSYREVVDTINEPDFDGTYRFVWVAPDRPICATHPAAAARSVEQPVPAPDPDPDQLLLPLSERA